MTTDIIYHICCKEKKKKINSPCHGVPEERLAKVDTRWAQRGETRERIANISVAIALERHWTRFSMTTTTTSTTTSTTSPTSYTGGSSTIERTRDMGTYTNIKIIL